MQEIRLPRSAVPFVLIGIGALVIGLFAPAMSLPIVGGIHFFGSPGSEWCIAFYVSIVLAAISIMKSSRTVALLAGVIGVVTTAIFIVGFQLRKDDMLARATADAGNGIGSSIVEAGINAMQLEWGVAVLIVGSLCLVTASVFGANATLMGHAIGNSIRELFTFRQVVHPELKKEQ